MILGRVIRPNFYIYALFVLQKSKPNKRLLFRSPQLRLLANATSKDRWTIMDKTFRWAKPNGFIHFVLKNGKNRGHHNSLVPRLLFPIARRPKHVVHRGGVILVLAKVLSGWGFLQIQSWPLVMENCLQGIIPGL